LKLFTTRLVLRPATDADAPRFAEILGNWNVVRMMRLAPHPYSLEMARAWIATHAGEREAGTAFRFVIEAEGHVLGKCDLDEIDGTRGDLGYWLDEAAWGKGFATEAARAVARFGFEQLGLPRLTSGRAADNTASGHVLTKVGFQEIGRTRLWSKPRQAEFEQVRYELPRAVWEKLN
jgi:[ribosomal protein S5]-alanine N-acetyltransferase